jgi:hypothetical protein
VKIKNKPISEGYKVWVAAQDGYTVYWLWHSRLDGPENVSKEGLLLQQTDSEPIRLAPTYALVIQLCRRLREVWPHQKLHLFLDNLFLNVPVAHALLDISILVTGTARKTAAGMPDWLIDIKTKNTALVWNTLLAEKVGNVLCFLWQDNNAVLGITTGFSLTETVLRERKRPKQTSTSARIVRPIFGDEHRKRLYIPTVIDRYNHCMNGVDNVDQLRAEMTTNRPYETRNWHPIHHFIIDTACVNAYCSWKRSKPFKQRIRRRFQSELAVELLSHPLESTAFGVTPKAVDTFSNHSWTRFDKRGFCKWCSTHPIDNDKRRRKVLGELTNQAERIRGGSTHGGCKRCNTLLCASGTCFKRFHSTVHIE